MIVALDMNKKMLIQDSIKKLNFYVTLMDAKQKPGAVMFLFEGEQTELFVFSLSKVIVLSGFRGFGLA